MSIPRTNESNIYALPRNDLRDVTPPEVDMGEGSYGDEASVVPPMPGQFLQHWEEPAVRFYHKHRPYYGFTNFSDYSVTHEGRRYPTGEHLFQASKFMETDPRLAEHIRKMPTPRAALQEASRMRSRQRRDWFDVNVGFMDAILELKFGQHPSLQRLLLATGEMQLIEDSPVDSFWGIGADGQGQNELGKALMRLRHRIREGLARQGASHPTRSVSDRPSS